MLATWHSTLYTYSHFLYACSLGVGWLESSSETQQSWLDNVPPPLVFCQVAPHPLCCAFSPYCEFNLTSQPPALFSTYITSSHPSLKEPSWLLSAPKLAVNRLIIICEQRHRSIRDRQPHKVQPPTDDVFSQTNYFRIQNHIKQVLIRVFGLTTEENARTRTTHSSSSIGCYDFEKQGTLQAKFRKDLLTPDSESRTLPYRAVKRQLRHNSSIMV